jgi:hypothetical protein
MSMKRGHGGPMLFVETIPEIGGKWSAKVTEGDRLIAACSHRHASPAQAQICGGKMAREALVRRSTTEREGPEVRS